MAKQRINVRVDPKLWAATNLAARDEEAEGKDSNATAILERALEADRGVQHALARISTEGLDAATNGR